MHIAIGLIVAFVLVALLSNRKTRACRWRADRRQDSEQGSYFRCMHCGAETRTVVAARRKSAYAKAASRAISTISPKDFSR